MDYPAWLGAEERTRADRFRREDLRRSYIAGRGLLRDVLGRYLAAPPEQLRFAAGPHGKPRLDWGEGPPPLHFNLSHAGDLALLAVSPDREVGVDVECIRLDVEIMSLARRFFAPEETEALAACPPPLRPASFFAVWTRKEALLKATGQGVTAGLARFVVVVDPGVPAAVLSDGESRELGRGWFLADLPAGEGHQAALAAAGPPGPLRGWRWIPRQ